MRRRTVVLGGIAAVAATSLARAAQQPRAAVRLDGPRLAAAQGPAQWLVVLCHGSGGDGPDMFGLARPLQAYLPNAAFVSPTGPFPREDFGYRWFPGAVAGDAIGMIMRGMRESSPVFDAFLEAELAKHQLGPDRLILVGFSQGSMMVLNAGLRRQALPAGIIAFAGLQVATEGMPRFRGAPPVLIVQGAEDGNGEARVGATRTALTAFGLPVQAHVLPNLGHAIDQRGIRLAGQFLQTIARAKG